MENKELEKLKHDLRGPLTVVQVFFDGIELAQLKGNQQELLVLAKKAVDKIVLCLK